MAGIERKSIREITAQDRSILIVGLIIGKSEPNIFLSKRSEEFCGVMTFTIRDSKMFYINVKVWSTKEKIDEVNRKFHLFDVIDVIGPKIVIVRNRDEQQFEPNTPTPYSLIITEECGCLDRHSITGITLLNSLEELQSEPLKPITTVLNLADVHSSGLHCAGQFVDLLVAVRVIKPTRNIISKKTGCTLQCMELIVIDKSLLTGLSFTIWNRGWIKRISEIWKPLETVLHLIDVRIGFSTFYKSAVIGMSSKSIIVENPDLQEADQLREFVLNTQLPDSNLINFSGFALPSVESIKTVMTVQQIYDRLNEAAEGEQISDQFTAVLYAIITKFDLDGFSSIVAKKCKCCKRRLRQSDHMCLDENCQLQYSFNDSGDKYEKFFDINLHLTDHTGTLVEARLSNNIAEEILGTSVVYFLQMTAEEKGKLKWQFLMERFELKLVFKRKSAQRSRSYAILVALSSISLDEVADKILVY